MPVRNMLSCNTCQTDRRTRVVTQRHTMFVCPSVRPSYVSIVPKCLNAGSLKQHRAITHELVFRCQRSQRNSNSVILNVGAKHSWNRLKSAIFDQYWQYLAILSQKRCKMGHSYRYHGQLIGTHISSIERCYFQ